MRNRLILILLVSWTVRGLFMVLVPAGVRSFDAFSWEHQAELMAKGGNPYSTGLFNWPPFWMMMCFGMAKVSAFLGVPFFRILQLVLISAESVVISLTYYVLRNKVGKDLENKAFWLVLFGLALNPVSILLVCQHCNFDVFMVLWILAFLISTMNFLAAGDKTDWLLSCLFLGMGILTKTVPLIFGPVLLAGFRRLDWKTRILGGCLTIGPVALGVGVIYVMDPADVGKWVLAYRGEGFFFGFPGLMKLFGLLSLMPIFHFCFYGEGIAVLALSSVYFWKLRKPLTSELVLYTAFVLLAIPTVGNGFGGHFFYWFIPLFVIVLGAFWAIKPFRILLITFGIVSAVTFIIEYGLIGAYGFSFLYLATGAHDPADLSFKLQSGVSQSVATVIHYHNLIDSEKGNTLERLPLFLTMLSVLFYSIWLFVRNAAFLETIKGGMAAPEVSARSQRDRNAGQVGINASMSGGAKTLKPGKRNN
ncbi:MAG TPA: hypothetical protein VGY56_21370 [Verrucomicrobiae bacterium]|nr:hypothetical protein [Verrucomicrobiae bacterium]